MTPEALIQGVKDIEKRLREDLAAAFTRHAYGELARGNPHPWDSDGFYTARDALEIAQDGYPMPWGELDFPVPGDCPQWSAPYADGAAVFRGFLRHAWLAMPDGDPTGVLAMPTHSTAPRIFASIHGELLEPLDEGAHDTTTVLWRLGKADPRAMLHLHCDAPIAFSPQLGRISCVVGKPFWFH